MDNLYLKLPEIDDKEEWLNYVKEMKENDLNVTPGGFRDDTIYEEWLEGLYNKRNNINLEEGIVPSTFYFLMSGDRILGSISIRHSINSESLARFGGHIGYNIRPTERRRGLATIMLNLALEKCMELGLEDVMITCKEDNIASAKTIENNCGKLKEIVFISEEDSNFKKYWINVREALDNKNSIRGKIR